MPTMMQETFKPLNGQMQNHFTLDVSIPWRTSPSALHMATCWVAKGLWNRRPIVSQSHLEPWARSGDDPWKNHHPVLPVLWENCWNMLKFHYHGHPKMDVQYSIPVPWRADFLVCQLSLFIVFVPHPHVPIVVGTWFTRVITQKKCFVLQVWWLAEGMSD